MRGRERAAGAARARAGQDQLALSSAALDGAPADGAVAALASLLARRASAVEDAAEEGDPLGDLLGEVLRFYGPVGRELLTRTFALDSEQERVALEVLLDEQRVVVDELTEDAAEPEICDAENLERLLRLTRAAARPAFEPLPADHLPAFLAGWQGLATRGAGIEDLRAALERLFGYAAAAELWETELLPARLEPYLPAWLDALLAESDLGWFGAGAERLAFALGPDRELFVQPPEPGAEEAGSLAPSELDAVLPPGPGRFSFEELLAHSGLGSAELTRRLWRLVWEGVVANDGFAALRRGVEARFEPAEAEPSPGGRPARRLRFERWKGSRPFAGSWFRLQRVEGSVDALEDEELAKDRARVVLERYGVVFRELLERELPALQWPRVFRALRLMELGGEVVAGQFFTGVPGLQFASRAAVRTMGEGLPEDRVWWVNAADPASPCGLGLEGLGELPRRIAGNRLVFHGHRLVVIAERRGRSLEIRVGPDHPDLPSYLGFLKVLATRAVRPARAIVVETVNGEPAASGPYRPALAALFHTTRDGSSLRLMRRY